MGIIVDFLAEGNSYRSDRKIRHKAGMIKVLSGENDTENIEEWLEQKGIREEDEITVCELFDQYVRQGRAEGLIKGKAEGLIEGKVEGLLEGKAKGKLEGKARQLVEDIGRTMAFFQVTLEKACESLGITVSRYEEAKTFVGEKEISRCKGFMGGPNRDDLRGQRKTQGPV